MLAGQFQIRQHQIYCHHEFWYGLGIAGIVAMGISATIIGICEWIFEFGVLIWIIDAVLGITLGFLGLAAYNDRRHRDAASILKSSLLTRDGVLEHRGFFLESLTDSAGSRLKPITHQMETSLWVTLGS